MSVQRRVRQADVNSEESEWWEFLLVAGNSGKLEHSNGVVIIEKMRDCRGEGHIAGQVYFDTGSIF